MNADLKLPHRLGKYRGKTYSRFTVVLEQSGLDRDFWQHSAVVEIIAASPAEACNAIKHELGAKLDHPTEFSCLGSRGGITARFLGYEGLVWAKMCQDLADWIQLDFVYE